MHACQDMLVLPSICVSRKVSLGMVVKFLSDAVSQIVCNLQQLGGHSKDGGASSPASNSSRLQRRNTLAILSAILVDAMTLS